MRPQIKNYLAVVTMCAIAFQSTVSRAENSDADKNGAGLAEIVVTATKSGATNLQQAPIAISAFNAAQLQQSVALNIKDIAPLTPSMQISQDAANAIIVIRGIGSNNVYAGSDPDVTMQIDGVYIGRPSGQFADFLDLDRIEILRGPQGTLYGRNAVGGTINLISRRPTDDFSAEQVLTLGNYGLAQGQAYVSGALVPGTLQGSLSADYIYHDNYEKNIQPGAQSGINNANHGGLRVQLRYEPSSNVDMTTRADWAYLDENLESTDHLLRPFPPDTLGATIIGNNKRIAQDAPNKIHQHIGGVSEEINVKLNDSYSLKSISAFRIDKYDFNLDTDDTPINFDYGSIHEDQKQLSQEINLNAKLDRFTGVAGLYYFYESDRQLNDVIVPPILAEQSTAPAVWTHSAAAFLQGTYELLPGLRLTAGGRYTHESKAIEANYQGRILAPDLSRIGNLPGFPVYFSTSPSFQAFTPKFGVDWQLDPNMLLYASATRGYKSGGVNFAATSIGTSTFQPEYIWSYELGAKTEWLDHRLRANATAFYYDYKNLQVQSGISAGVVVINNAATATNKGVEIELLAQPVTGFQVDLVGSYLDARYSRFADASVPSGLPPFLAGDPKYDAATHIYDATGNYLDYAPRWSGSAGAQYEWALPADASLYVRGDVSFQSRTFYDPSNSYLLSQGGYTLYWASFGYRSKSNGWSVELWGKNLADKQYFTAIAADSLEPAGEAAPPRTFGIRIGKKW